MLRIGIVAGEASGDLLGAGLIKAILQQVPDAQIEGIAGPNMISAGCHALFPSEKLAVMGLVEVLGHLREITGIRKQLYTHFIKNPPDIFIGIDAPDFNLLLEARLKKAGIKAIHYVSPTVWAWRQWRVKKIAGNIDLMLTLFPFEAEFYEKYDIPVKFVGHPLADMIPMEPDRPSARGKLGLPIQQKIIALLPGSRVSEVERLSEVFIKAAHICWKRNPDLYFLAPMANDRVKQVFLEKCDQYAPDLPITLIDGKSREVMEAADMILLASGTATLEAMLMKRPMIVAYKLSSITYWILKKLGILKISLYSLPNLLAGKEVVKELIQNDCNPENLAVALQDLLDHPEHIQKLEGLFVKIHKQLKKDASLQASNAVLSLVDHHE
jgi:lipid-A-disaccharide synthase